MKDLPLLAFQCRSSERRGLGRPKQRWKKSIKRNSTQWTQNVTVHDGGEDDDDDDDDDASSYFRVVLFTYSIVVTATNF